MNDLLFYALLAALIYYFFFYLPKKKLERKTLPIFENKATQTDNETITEYEPGPENTLNCPGAIPNPQIIQKLEKDIHQKEKTIIGLNNSYNKLETKKNEQINNLKNQLKEQETKLKELSENEKTLNNLIKNIQALNNEL